MNFVKQFQLSDMLNLQKLESSEEVNSFLKKKGCALDTISNLICEVYQFATINDYSVQQKQKLVNLAIQLLTCLPSAQTKEKFHDKLINDIEKLSLREQNGQCTFNQVQLLKIKELLTMKILPYYQLYEIVLDNNPHFELEAKISSVVKNVEEKSLSSGTSVEVQNIDALKDFIGIRAAKEEKKDPKKK